MQKQGPTATRILIAVGFAISCFGLALFLFIVNRSYMLTFFGPPIVLGFPICGIVMLATALIMIVSGFLIVQKIVDIEV